MGAELSYRVLAEHTTVGIVHADLDFRVIYVNPTMRSWMGVGADEDLGAGPILDYFMPESVSRIKENLAKRTAGESSTYEVELVSRTGERRSLVLSGSPILDPEGKTTELIATFVNTTEFKRTAFLLQKTVEAIPEGVLLVDNLGRILAYNQRFLRIWDVPPEIMREETQSGLLAHIQSQLVDPVSFMKMREAEFANPSTPHLDNRFVLKTGRTIEVYRQIQQIDDQTHARVICVKDITDRVRMEARLKHSDRISTIGQMAAGVAHEINNPLTHLIGGLELVLESLASLTAMDAKAIGELSAKLQVLHRSSVRISGIVNDLKTFSRPEADTMEPVDVKAVIESTVALLKAELVCKAQVNLALRPTPPVMANEGRLGQILMNLLINALQALRNDSPRENEITIGSGIDSLNRVFIEVKDNGVGIPREDLSRIYEPFFTTKGSGVGTGLGLPICYALVQGFKGEIEVESEVGKGTTFRVILPKLATNPLPVAKPGAMNVGKSKAAVLVIDDEMDICDLIRGAIGNDHEVRCCHSGREAIDLLRGGPLAYDVILCDLTLPEIDGIEVFRAACELAPEVESRFMFITGGALSQSAENFIRSHSGRILSKPFRLKDLREAIAARINT